MTDKNLQCIICHDVLNIARSLEPNAISYVCDGQHQEIHHLDSLSGLQLDKLISILTTYRAYRRQHDRQEP